MFRGFDASRPMPTPPSDRGYSRKPRSKEGVQSRPQVSVLPDLPQPRAEQQPEASMTTAKFEQFEATEARKLLRWRRFAELIRGGFDPSDAFVLSTDPEIDVRQAVDLLARDCPRATALRILL